MTGENDIKYGLTFLNILNALSLYSKDKEIGKKYSDSFDGAINYLKNKISLDRSLRDNLMYDLENIAGGIDTAMGDAVDFNKIMPPEYKTLQTLDRQIQILKSVKQGEAKEEDIKMASDFFGKLIDGYLYFADQNRHDIFSGALA